MLPPMSELHSGPGRVVLLQLAESSALRLVAAAVGVHVSKRDAVAPIGASWGTLMLSPVAGALAGWLGVLLIGALADGGLNIFASDLHVSWRQQPDGVELAIAFLLGFSERLFTSTVTATTERLLPTPEAPLGPGTQGGKQSPPTPTP